MRFLFCLLLLGSFAGPSLLGEDKSNKSSAELASQCAQMLIEPFEAKADYLVSLIMRARLAPSTRKVLVSSINKQRNHPPARIVLSPREIGTQFFKVLIALGDAQFSGTEQDQFAKLIKTCSKVPSDIPDFAETVYNTSELRDIWQSGLTDLYGKNADFAKAYNAIGGKVEKPNPVLRGFDSPRENRDS